MTRKRNPNLVPTPATRAVADAMLADTVAKESGFEAALHNLASLDPDQYVALLGVLLNHATRSERSGKRPTVWNPAERRAGENRYRQGIRDPQTVSQHREYQRIRARAYRAAKREVA